jgi:GT2 family glycosyltransferase
MSQPLVSIVILCHDDAVYLPGCAASIRRHTRVPYELILVDNGSTDDAAGAFRSVRRALPCRVRVLRNRENRFFAAGNNQGMATAAGEYLLLLNADTVVAPGWLESLLACVRRDPGLGTVGPYTNHAAGPQVLWPERYDSVRGLDRWALAWAEKRRGRIRYVPWIIGFCMLLPRRVLERVGDLDERFGPGGFEDYDYCLRLRLAGYRIAIAEDSYVHHYGGRGYVHMGYDSLRLRNREVYRDKWGQWTFDRVRGGSVAALRG